MELPIKVIVLIVIVVMTLVVLSTFFLQSTGESLSRADAERVFNTQCQNYVREKCTWDVTYRPEFASYLQACRVLYGSHRDSYSCLYTLCQGCFENVDVKCAGFCNICRGHSTASVDVMSCCSKFSAECQGTTVDCSDACP